MFLLLSNLFLYCGIEKELKNKLLSSDPALDVTDEDSETDETCENGNHQRQVISKNRCYVSRETGENSCYRGCAHDLAITFYQPSALHIGRGFRDQSSQQESRRREEDSL